MHYPVVKLKLPDWIEPFLAGKEKYYHGKEDKMHLVVDLSRQNIMQKTGGPFGAAVFDSKGHLIAPGVNMVVSSSCSAFHAEIVAISIAQKVLGRYDIGDAGRSCYTLVTSTEPCAMCLGAIPWSGVSKLICGARDKDARDAGFVEGDKPLNWVHAFKLRGIEVERDVLRGEAAAVLHDYAVSGEVIYNSGQPVIL